MKRETSTNKDRAKADRDPGVDFDGGLGQQEIDDINRDTQASEHKEDAPLKTNGQKQQHEVDAAVDQLECAVILVHFKVQVR